MPCRPLVMALIKSQPPMYLVVMTEYSFMTALLFSLLSRLSPKITEIYLSAEYFSLVDLQINQLHLI